jgi:glycosyltransferase involved in cell wall biosynthesis
MRGIGVDTGHYTSEPASPEEKAETLARIGLAADASFFVVVAELSPNKRHADIVRALAAAKHADASVVFAGEGHLQPSLESLADQLGVRDRVKFLGFVKDVRPLLRAAVAGVLASAREGLPRSIMECLSAGTPVIGTAARGVAELLTPESGIVVPVGDVEGLARAMDWILDHPEEAEAMGQHGRSRMRGVYDLDAVLVAHERMYADLLRERRQRATPRPT